jgi:hypothetical protein
MGAVFVSYRRGDSEGQARALSLELVRLLGKDSVFMDVDSIALGRDFRQVVQERLGSCDVMLALIGPEWLDAKDGAGQRRLDTPTDFVRQELAAALKRNIPVIPVLLQGTQMPQPERLPDDLKDLSYRNGFELGHSTWESDVREMVNRLGLNAAKAAPRDDSTQSAPLPWRRYGVAAGIALVAGAVGLIGYLNWPSSPGSDSEPLPPSTVRSLAAAGIEFAWPGGDCWDIFRGTEFVAFHCGANSQALSAGRYTIKGKYAPVFAPFDVTVNPGAPTKIALGGVFEFAWPGGDCWDIFRGEELVTFHCGKGKQALAAGRYTIKAKYGPVFAPFQIQIEDGKLVKAP